MQLSQIGYQCFMNNRDFSSAVTLNFARNQHSKLTEVVNYSTALRALELGNKVVIKFFEILEKDHLDFGIGNGINSCGIPRGAFTFKYIAQWVT